MTASTMTVDVSNTADPRKEILARNIKRFREEAGLSQADASFAAEVPIDNLRRYEQGSSTPDPFVLQQLGKAYGHSLDDFFNPDPPPARLDDRPAFLLRTMPGVDVDPELQKRLQEQIDKANREFRELREKKTKKKP